MYLLVRTRLRETEFYSEQLGLTAYCGPGPRAARLTEKHVRGYRRAHARVEETSGRPMLRVRFPRTTKGIGTRNGVRFPGGVRD